MSKVKIVCSYRDHREVLVCQLGPPGITFPDGMYVYTLPCGTLLAEPRPSTPRALYQRPGVLSGGNPVHGGNKLRPRCRVPSCPLDVPLSWTTVEQTDWARKLLQSGRHQIELIELAHLAATLSK